MEHYYQRIQGWFDSLGFYREMVRKCPNGGTMVEVGVWKGRSFCCLLVEIANSGKSIQAVAVDHFGGSIGEPELLAAAAVVDLAAEFSRNVTFANYDRWQLVNEPSVVAASRFADVDFVFIDASHDYESVSADIRAWLPAVKPGGIIAGHDAGYAAVELAFTELLGTCDITEGCWWHVVQGDEVPRQAVVSRRVHQNAG